MHLLFDLDGTLTDSRPGILASIQHALRENRIPVPTVDELSWCIGPPILETLRKLSGPHAPELFEPVVQAFRSRYSTVGLLDNSVFPEIESTLDELLAAGHTLHVATSKMEAFAVRVVDEFNLRKYFTSVYGSGMDGSRADKTELISHVLADQKISPTCCVMIGDREHDIIGATNNGLPSIGALWGYGTGAELVAAGATLTARLPRLLPELILSLQP